METYAHMRRMAIEWMRRDCWEPPREYAAENRRWRYKKAQAAFEEWRKGVQTWPSSARRMRAQRLIEVEVARQAWIAARERGRAVARELRKSEIKRRLMMLVNGEIHWTTRLSLAQATVVKRPRLSRRKGGR